MDPDFVYAEALAEATGASVSTEPQLRTLVWRDPALLAADAGDAPTAS
jgi:hypothetical protein